MMRLTVQGKRAPNLHAGAVRDKAAQRGGSTSWRRNRAQHRLGVTFDLSSVVPWGRSFAEYISMFSLSEADLAGRILGCADGPASFQAEAHAQAIRVISVDPLYRFSACEIEERIQATYQTVLEQLRQNQEYFVWDHLPSPEHVGEIRLAAMREFLRDYPRGRKEGRYRIGELPALPFAQNEFELALCSHFLFLYSEHYPLSFHLSAIRELGRVAREVRIFPLLCLSGEVSPHVEPVRKILGREGWRVERVGVPYEFQRGGNEMLRLVRSPPDDLPGGLGSTQSNF